MPFININKSFINIRKSFLNINESFININKSFINIRKCSFCPLFGLPYIPAEFKQFYNPYDDDEE